jgi:hypothetical protein
VLPHSALSVSLRLTQLSKTAGVLWINSHPPYIFYCSSATSLSAVCYGFSLYFYPSPSKIKRAINQIRSVQRPMFIYSLFVVFMHRTRWYKVVQCILETFCIWRGGKIYTYNFGFRVWASSNVDYLPTFRQTLLYCTLLQCSTRLTPESRSYALNSSCENLGTRKYALTSSKTRL